jgi:hypothetical protein
MLSMLVKVLCSDSIATRRRLSSEGNVTFEDSMRGATYFEFRAVTIEGLTSVRYLLLGAVGIITVSAAIWSPGLSWSHDTLHFDERVDRIAHGSADHRGRRRCRGALRSHSGPFSKHPQPSPLRGHLCVLGAIARTRRSRERPNAKTWENGGAGDTAVGSRPQRRWCERGSDKQWKGCIYLGRPRNTYRTLLAQDGKFCFPKNEWRAPTANFAREQIPLQLKLHR